MKMHDVPMFGNAVWYSYDYSIDTPHDHVVSHGMAKCAARPIAGGASSTSISRCTSFEGATRSDD
jgi:hypothetical protein